MAMVLESVVPFGRSFDEYVQMFNLTPGDLAGTVLGVGDGPASFNAEGTACGYQITSIDPLYTFTGEAIQSRFDAVVEDIIAQVKASPQDWVWSYHRSPDDLRANRIRAIERFLEDYSLGKQSQRYQVGALPNLPFASQQFSLALCSHLLFLYSDQFDLDFHLAAITEMLRVAPEVRLFPLLTLMRQRSPQLEPTIAHFREQGYVVQVRSVTYELQKGGNQMLVIQT